MSLFRHIQKRMVEQLMLRNNSIRQDSSENVYGPERTITVSEIITAIGKAKKVAYKKRTGSTPEDVAYKEGVVSAIETLKMFLGRDVVLLDISDYENK